MTPRWRSNRAPFALMALVAGLSSGCGSGHDVLLGDGPPCAAVPAETTALLGQASGFGRHVTGGLGGCLYHVTTLADSGAGSLREGLSSPDPRWIVFDLSGTIELSSALKVESNKTLDGRGRAVTLRNGGLVISNRFNVLVENLSFTAPDLDPAVSATDAIGLDAGSHDVWIDHCSFSSYPDGLVDIRSQSTDVTVSWSRFENHVKVMLISANVEDTTDTVIRVTVHHNWFSQTHTYHPRLRFGRVHAFNNFLDRWGLSGILVAMNGQVASEDNIMVAGATPDGLLTQAGTDPTSGLARSSRDWLLNGAVVNQNQPDAVFLPQNDYPYTSSKADETLRTQLTTETGAH